MVLKRNLKSWAERAQGKSEFPFFSDVPDDGQTPQTQCGSRGFRFERRIESSLQNLCDGCRRRVTSLKFPSCCCGVC